MPNSAKAGKRDPLKDPKAGDVLRKDCVTVSIDTAESSAFAFRCEGWGGDIALLMPRWNEDWRPRFRKWAKNAEVVHAAE